MSNNDDQKIVWKKTNQSDISSETVLSENQTISSENLSQNNQIFSRIPGIDVEELSKRSADQSYKQDSNSLETEATLNDLRSEINAALGVNESSVPENSFQQKMNELKNKVNSGEADIIPETVQTQPIPEVQEEVSPLIKEKTDEELISELKKDIQKNFDVNDSVATPEQAQTEYQKSLGVEQTYYSDLSGAMTANDPATMSELIKRSRFEKKAEEISSPRNYKNILFIIGAALFVISALILVFTFFKPKEKVQFVTKEKVTSLVDAERHTGINVDSADDTLLKQAIRKTLEKKIPEDTINHIYYLGKNATGQLGRLGIKDVFDATTGSHIPQKLYDTIENDFMHGVYKTDKNYPFMILKAVSYDRALEGMKEWEPYMVDDLAVFFDLPPEATDRSLIQNGFSDDLIHNKTARVVRFLPRSVDRKGILQLLEKNNIFNKSSDKDTQDSGETTREGLIPNISNILGLLRETLSHSAFAQNTRQVSGKITLSSGEADAFVNIGVLGTSLGGQTSINGNFQIGVPDGNQTLKFSYVGCTDQTKSIGSGNITGINIQLTCENILDEVVVTAKKNDGLGLQTFNSGGANMVCYLNESCVNQYGVKVDISQKGQSGVRCISQLQNGPDDPVFPGSLDGTPGYACFDALDQNATLDQLSTTDPVCFNPVTGYRLSAADQTALGASPENPSGFCFPSYECHVYECTKAGTVVENRFEGQPGVSCTETNQKVNYSWTGQNGKGQKICRQFTELLTLPQVHSDLLCFDKSGKFLSEVNTPDPTNGIRCITTLSREAEVCIVKSDDDYYLTDSGVSGSICLESLPTDTLEDIQPNQCKEFPEAELRNLAGGAGLQLRFVAGISSLLGMKAENVAKINNVANFLFEYAYGNILQNEAVRTGARIVEQLEQVLNAVDPNEVLPQTGPNGGLNLYGYIRNIIYVTKCSLGIADSLQWNTLGRLPQGFTIYAGQSIDGLTQIQQALVLIGLMDPISITGSLDTITQDAVSHFQLANGLSITGILDPNTLLLLGTIQEQQNNFLNGEDALIRDYFISANEQIRAGNVMALGAYSNQIQNLQSVLRVEGYSLVTNSGYFDQATCNALREYQKDNNLRLADQQTCTVSIETLGSLNNLIDQRGWIELNGQVGSSANGNGSSLETNSQINGSGGSGNGSLETNSQINSLSLDDYFALPNQLNGSNNERNLSLGAYNQDVQSLQLLLYGEGYDIPIINGLYDQTTCDAVRNYQKDHNLESADTETCTVSAATVESLNGTMRDKNYLGSGFKVIGGGESLGVGLFSGKSAPGGINFLTNSADADSLKEGDVVLMYMFLDEHTILIARNEQVIDEIIHRRAFHDIFSE